MWNISGGPWKYFPIPCPANAGRTVSPLLFAYLCILKPMSQNGTSGPHNLIACTKITYFKHITSCICIRPTKHLFYLRLKVITIYKYKWFLNSLVTGTLQLQQLVLGLLHQLHQPKMFWSNLHDNHCNKPEIITM